MTGGLLQLKYMGASGNIFVGNPQISFFKSIFKTYGNFSTESVNVSFVKTPNFNDLTQSKIPINGDLINQMYLNLSLTLNVRNNYDINNIILPSNITGTTPANRHDISSSNFLNGTGLKYEYDKKLDKNCIYIYNYKYIIAESEFTNKINKDSLIVSEININNIYNNLFNKIDNTIDLTNVSSDNLYVLFSDNNNEYFSAKIYIKSIEEDLTRFIKNISFEIDEYIIDKHNTEWLLAYDNYFNNDVSKSITKKLKCITPDMFNKKVKLYIPLRFYFTQVSNNALPIIALYHSNCVVKLYTNSINDTFSFVNDIIISCPIEYCNLSINYIHLDKEEKKFFISNPHELLIEQVQYQKNSIKNDLESNIELTFTYLSKYLIWNIPYNYYLDKAKIVFNNQDLCEELDGEYFHLIQPLEYSLGNKESFSRMEYNKNINGTYYLYSFSLKPNEKQPAGMCNMSRIDDKFLKVFTKNINNSINNNNEIDINLFSVNYNFLIIKGGKCKLKF